MAAITRRVAPGAAASSRSVCRVKPFTSAGRWQRSTLSRGQVVRVAEEEAPAVEEVVEAVAMEDDDFAFNLRDARAANEYQPSDVEAALKYFSEGAGDMPYEADHVTNTTGVEDASVFDDVDDGEAYGTDEMGQYAAAGISEAAPKSKRGGGRRGGRGDEEEIDDMSDEMRAIEEERIAAAAFDDLGLDDEELYGDAMDPKDAPWSWDTAGEADADAASGAVWEAYSSPVAAVEEDALLASLATVDMAQVEVPDEVKEVTPLLVEDMDDLLDDDEAPYDADDADDAADDGAPLLSQAEEASIDELLGADLGDVPTLISEDALLPAAEGGDDDEDVALDEGEVAAYIAALQAMEGAEAGAPAEEVLAALGEGGEAPEAVTDVDEEVPELGQMANVDVPAELLKQDAAFEAALAADDAADAAGLDGFVAELAELAGVPAVEYSAAMFPEDADLEVFENLLGATAEYAEVLGEDGSGEVVPSADDAWFEDVNMYDDLPEDLVARTSALADADAEEADRELEGFAERVLELSRVTKVVKGGKIMGFRAVVVIGDGKGRVAVGCESGREVATAVKRALVDARKAIVAVPLVRAGTVPHRVEAWFKGCGVVINPATDGTGVIAGSSVRSVLELAGVQNVLAKRLGGRSQLNNARATIKAILQLRTMDDVARARGLPLDYLLR